MQVGLVGLKQAVFIGIFGSRAVSLGVTCRSKQCEQLGCWHYPPMTSSQVRWDGLTGEPRSLVVSLTDDKMLKMISGEK